MRWLSSLLGLQDRQARSRGCAAATPCSTATPDLQKQIFADLAQTAFL
jgi:hypothetical protein